MYYILKLAFGLILSIVLFSCGATLEDYLDSYSFTKSTNEFGKDTQSSKNYLIIGEKSVIANIDDFQNHKRSLGFNVRIATVDNMYTGFDSDTEKIRKLRNFILAEKESYNTHYLLLIGSMKTIPMEASS